MRYAATVGLAGGVLTLALLASALRPGSAEGGPQAGRPAPPDSPTPVSPLLDPGAMVQPDRCGECHWAEHESWRRTSHATGYDTMHRRESAERIIDNLGLHLVKRDSPCLACHYTPQQRDGQLRAVAGVSCESCHGAARDWIEVHNDYGVEERDPGAARRMESDEHRRQRVEASRAAGMRRPSDVYGLLTRCFACHLVPDERLVNVGEHGTGSAGFEVVSRLEPIRHDFLASFLEGDGRTPTPKTVQDRRVPYVVGRGIAVEYGLRALAAATDPEGRYFRAAFRRLDSDLDELAEVGMRTGLDLPDRILDIVADAEIRAANPAPLVDAADRIGALLAEYGMAADPDALAGIDPLIVDPDGAPRLAGGFDLTLAPEPSSAVADRLTDPAGASGHDPADNPPEPGVDDNRSSASPSGAAARTVPVSRAVSDIGVAVDRPPWMARPVHRMLRPGSCGGCHGAQDGWWFDDAHARAADPFFERRALNVAIARTYGLDPGEMSRGDRLCMQCHGTVAPGREEREVDMGVGCQRCHGPGEGYREPHETDYGAALSLGLVDLKSAATRARVCADCHYVNDERLLSAGHPSGADFDLSGAVERTRHWDHVSTEPEALVRAWAAEIDRRGPLPQVPVYLAMENRAPAETVPAPSAAGGESLDPDALRAETAAGRTRPTEPPNRDVAPPASRRPPVDATLDPGLPPLAIDADRPVSEILTALHQRLQLLYRLLGRGTGSPGDPGPDDRPSNGSLER